jgi:plastocyanin
MNRSWLLVGVAAVAALATACSSSGGGSSQSAGAKTSAAGAATSSAAVAGSTAPQIVISSFAYSGALTVKPGQKVSVVNKDSVAHTLTDKANHKFDTGTIDPGGGKGTFTAPMKPGSYPFGCNFHPEMHGTLVVKA